MYETATNDAEGARRAAQAAADGGGGGSGFGGMARAQGQARDGQRAACRRVTTCGAVNAKGSSLQGV